MSADQIRKLHLDNQRETIRQQYKFKCDLLHLTRVGAKVVYANQAEAANKIITEFMSGKVWVVLVAQPGVGKTGTILEVLRQFGQHIDPKWQAHLSDMLLLTGMSDTEWTRTVADGTLPIFEKIIHHRQQLTCRARNAPAMSTMRDGLIITDECHVAAQEDQTIHKALKNAGLGTIEALKERNMRMLDVSATPEGVLHDLRRWREDTAVVVLEPDEKYKGFQSMKDEHRLLSSKDFDLEKLEHAHRLIQLFDDRYKKSSTKKYFAFRISSDIARGNIRNACLARGWDTENHDSKDRVEDIDAVMGAAPPRHKVFFVKGFWRASKRIVRKHVGGSYEAPTKMPDDTAKSQGLTARFCSTFDWEGEQENIALRPLHFDDIESIDRYLEWTRAGYDYNAAAYRAPRLRSDGEGNVKHPRTKAADAGGVVDENTPPTPKFKLSRNVFDTVREAKDWWKNPESAVAEPHDIRFNITQYRIYETPDGKCIKYRGGLRRLITEAEARSGRTEVNQGTLMSARIMPVSVGEDLGREGVGTARIVPVIVPDIQSGIASSARILPIETDTSSVKYIVVYKPDAVYRPRSSPAGADDASSTATEEESIATAPML